MKEFVVSYRSPPTMRGFAHGTFNASEGNLARNLLATLSMGYIITEIRLRDPEGA